MSKLLRQNLTQQYSVDELDDMLDFLFLQIPLQIMFLDFVKYCNERNLPHVRITRVIDEMIPGISVSKTHEQGRAIDISTKGWYADQIRDVISYMDNKYKAWGAIPFGDLTASNPLVYHKGTGYHFHMQIRPNLTDYSIKPL